MLNDAAPNHFFRDAGPRVLSTAPPVLGGIKEFQSQHPRIEVRIDAEGTSRAFDAFDDEIVVVAGPDPRLASRNHITAAELADEHFLSYSTLDDNTVYQRLLRPRGLTVSTTQVRLTEAMVELVRAGMGVAVLARWAVEREIDDGMLMAIPLTSRAFPRRWYAATLRTRQSRDFDDRTHARIAS